MDAWETDTCKKGGKDGAFQYWLYIYISWNFIIRNEYKNRKKKSKKVVAKNMVFVSSRRNYIRHL